METCYTSQLKNVFRLEDNGSRVVNQNSPGGTKLTNSLGKQLDSHVIR